MQNILIIGASSGIGAAIARHLTAEGKQVWSASRRPSPDVPAAHHQQYDAMTGGTLELPEVLDGFVYCPGSINLRPFHRITPEQFREEYELNSLGAVRALQQALPALKKSSAASVVFFSTVAVERGMPFHSSIAMAKGAIEGLTRALAAEFAPAIRVNAIAPSITDTPLASRILSSEDKKNASAARHPLKKVGTPDDIAHAAMYLLSPASSWMTGQILHLDGGMSSLAPL